MTPFHVEVEPQDSNLQHANPFSSEHDIQRLPRCTLYKGRVLFIWHGMIKIDQLILNPVFAAHQEMQKEI